MPFFTMRKSNTLCGVQNRPHVVAETGNLLASKANVRILNHTVPGTSVSFLLQITSGPLGGEIELDPPEYLRFTQHEGVALQGRKKVGSVNKYTADTPSPEKEWRQRTPMTGLTAKLKHSEPGGLPVGAVGAMATEPSAGP